jgi:hypothetical protein
MFCILAAVPGFGKEVVFLTSGFQLEAQSHVQENETLVFRTANGTLEVPSSAIDRIELSPDDPVYPEHPVNPVISTEPPETLLRNAAVSQGLPPELVRSVARIESGLHQEAVSRKGALGLMQLMPATAMDLGVDANSARENAVGGAKYLRALLLRYRGDAVLALAAYNAGPAAVEKFRGVPPYSETRRYVERVLRELAHEQKIASRAAPELRASNPTSTK